MEANMDSSDLKMWESCRLRRQMVQINSRWLVENITEMEERLKDLLEWIEEDMSFWKTEPEAYSENKSELIANMEEFCLKYNSLAETYGHLNGEMQRCGLIVDELKNSGKPAYLSQQESPLLTPYQTPYQKMDVQTPYLTPFEMLGTQKSGQQTVDLNLSHSSSFGSLVLSLKEGTQSSSSSEFEFVESSEDSYEIVSDQDAEGDMVNILEGGSTESYEQMNLSNYQEQLMDSSVKHELSENEVTRLRDELEKSKSLADNLQAQLEYAQEEVKTRDIDLDIKRTKMLDMYDHVTELETANLESEKSIEKLTEELKVTKERLNASDEENAKLKKDISDQITQAANALGDVKKNYSLEKMKLQSDMNELEAANSDSKMLIEKLTVDLRVTKDELKVFDEENAGLKKSITDQTNWVAREVEFVMKKAHEERLALESKFDTKKKLISELQERISKFETDMSERDREIQELKDALGDANENCSLETMKLEFVTEMAQEERIDLESKLDSKNMLVSELQERISKFKIDMSDRDHEIQKLNVALKNANEKYASEELEKKKLQSDMNELRGKIMQLKEIIEFRRKYFEDIIARMEVENSELHNIKSAREFEMRTQAMQNKSLDEKIAQLAAEKLEMQNLHDVKELEMQCEINSLKADVTQKNADAKALYEDLDKLKPKCDMLEKEIEKERERIAEIAEEKREAIRQLCLSMEYYRLSMEYYRDNYVGQHQAFYLRKQKVIKL